MTSNCNGITAAGKNCSFKALEGYKFCKRHMKKEHNEASTSTDDDIYNDLETANQIIVDLVHDLVEKESALSELLELYIILEDQLTQLNNI